MSVSKGGGPWEPGFLQHLGSGPVKAEAGCSYKGPSIVVRNAGICTISFTIHSSSLY